MGVELSNKQTIVIIIRLLALQSHSPTLRDSAPSTSSGETSAASSSSSLFSRSGYCGEAPVPVADAEKPTLWIASSTLGAMTLARNRRFDDGQPTISEVMVIDLTYAPLYRSQLVRAQMDRIGRGWNKESNLSNNASAAKSNGDDCWLRPFGRWRDGGGSQTGIANGLQRMHAATVRLIGRCLQYVLL